ncbi:ribonuclease HII [Vibrio nigripulchritudo SFn27]|uniref:Ribonuclease HII n=1 Tax=Vibrio nigripulchritudo TaxID=28173 RepID=U4KDG7_9VIBR|nr:ribonuclease HII [Vibrio nigripulchritudo]CCN84982.1 ribonuclease HII [Vibrio nigripulchritudo BLFn1]CCN90194.1 ribonuclease HII [Vibrio nigripulchritudo SFn27]CCN94194.1 ribonuclease HII [Vibrio nigripulchritudo ENn2]CCO42548.1 ribonuclease HII [Vibrio nigripulchritudo SFn135]CCO51349.1 ribonuclease HII [Vibrio nigripulchritudo Wn13]
MAKKEQKEFPPFEYPEGYQLFAGVDEVGRGPLVGDVVTAAVILDPANPIEGLTDSKKLSEKKRLALFPEIQEKALAWAVGRCSPDEIDELNILQATMVAMQRAITGLKIQPDFALIDGNRVPELPMAGQAVVKGDLRVAEISAASIIAKVVRDAEMDELDKKHPEFGFANHKGYPTKAHFEAIEKHGVISEHRKSFKPVKRALGIE